MSHQSWDPGSYSRHAGFVAELGSDLIDLLAPTPTDAILDLGCGDGSLTAKLAPSNCRIIAIDSSAAQVAAARALQLDARVGDGEALNFRQEFDGVLSNAALHWMKRPEAVLAGIWQALRPGGRFVAEMGGAGNVESVVTAAADILNDAGYDAQAFNPWFFPTVEQYRALLEQQGFEVEFIKLFERPTPQGGDIVHWLRLFAQSFASALPEADREAFYAEIAARVSARLQNDDHSWYVDYVRLRFKAWRPAAAAH